MSKILITAAGTGAAFSYATAIAKNFPQLEVYTADTNLPEYTTSSLFSKKHFKVPLSNSKDYEAEVESIIKNENIDFYLPLLDLEIYKAHESEFLKTKLIANNSDFCKACIEKDHYHIWANKKDIKTPLLLDESQLNNYNLFVLKKNGGFGSRDTEIISLTDILELNLADHTVYEHITGEEFTIDCFPTADKVVTTVRERIEVKNGVSVKTKIAKNDYLNEVATKIVTLFDLTHPFCFQVIKKEDNYYLIDVNPRLGGGTAMSAAAGCDYFSAHIALILDEDPKEYLSETYDSCIVTRQYANYLMKVL